MCNVHESNEEYREQNDAQCFAVFAHRVVRREKKTARVIARDNTAMVLIEWGEEKYKPSIELRSVWGGGLL